MNKMKLYKKQIVTLISSISLITLLASCAPNNSNNNIKENEQKQITENPQIEKESNINLDRESADEYIEEYVETLNNDIENNENESKIKEKIINLIDFVFNEKEINGYTFDELTEEGKKNVINSVNELDETIDKYIPNYKERFKNWISDKKEKLDDYLVEKGADLKEIWNTYNQKVDEELQQRQKTR